MAVPQKINLSKCMSSHDLDVNPSSNSAQLVKAAREIKELRFENEVLKKKFAEINSLYGQLVAESDQENYSQWRVMLLKSHLIQLERQLIVLTDALSRRSAVVLEVENSLAAAVDLCRSHLLENEKMPVLRLNRLELERLAQTIESSRMKLFRDTEVTLIDKVKQPLHAWNQFIRNDKHAEPTSLIDLCTGSVDHINVKHVSQLEMKLASLYGQLKLVADLLNTSGSSHGLPKTVRERLAGQVSNACNLLNETNQQLLKLSVLVPAMPLPSVDALNIKDLNADDILKAFRKCYKGQNVPKDIQHFIHMLVKTVNHSVSVTEAERKLLVDELKFHCSIYDIQSDFMDSLLASIKEEYFHFESDLQIMICEPVKELLSAFEQLKQGTNDKSMQIFFQVLKSHELQLAEIVDKLSADITCGGKEQVLSDYGKHFLEKMSLACSKHEKKRDRQLSEVDSLRTIQDEHCSEFFKVFSDKDGIQKTVCKTPSINDQKDELVQGKHDLEYAMRQSEKNDLPPCDVLKKESRCAEQKQENTIDRLSLRFAKSSCSDNVNNAGINISVNQSSKKKEPVVRKEPVVALAKLRLKQPLECNLPTQKSSVLKFQTGQELPTALKHLKESNSSD